MEQILIIRATIIKIYKQHETLLNYILKFIAALIIFSVIGKIGVVREELSFMYSFFSKSITLVLMAFLFTVLPATAGYMLLSLDIALRMSTHTEAAVIVFLFLMLIVIFYVRLAPKESYMIIATVLCFYFKVPYIAAIFAGLYLSLTGVLPIVIGTFLYYFASTLNGLLALETAELDVMKMLTTVPVIITFLKESVTNNFTWVFVSFVLCMVFLAVFVISKISMNYSKEISVLFGGLLGMFSFILVKIIAGLDMGFMSIIFFSIISIGVMLIVQFFDLALDYSATQRVRFSDEDYYYYVKMIPKLTVEQNKPEKKER